MKLTKYVPLLAALTGAITVAAFAGEALPGMDARPAGYFYTGRPYDADLEGYVFKYRIYSPISIRWTTPDPSGFPDVANNRLYAPVPTNDFDYQGLLKWTTLTNTNTQHHYSQPTYTITWDVWTVKTNDESATVTLWDYVSGNPSGLDYSYNCHGFTFGNSGYWIDSQVDDILRGDGYRLITGEDKSAASVAYWGDDVHTAIVREVVDGNVTEVMGKRGAQGMRTSSPGGQGYGSDVQYYE